MIDRYLWRHLKSKQIVRYLAMGTEVTDIDRGRSYNGVIYCPIDNEHCIYFCNESVFKSRFEPLLVHEIAELGMRLQSLD